MRAEEGFFSYRTVIGANKFSSGTVTVSGPGSTWFTGEELTVGQEGTGTLIVQNGSSVVNDFDDLGASTTVFIGGGPSGVGGGIGTVKVIGPGSSWTTGFNSESVRIGYLNGTGTLVVQNGANVSNAFVDIAYGGLSWTGVVTVDGPGSQ